MPTTRRAFVIAACAGSGATARPARAQEGFPNRPIRLVVPFVPGGVTDSSGRLIADFLSRRLGQQVVVDNKPGAGGAIGSDIVAKAVPDGYTLLLATSSTHSIGPSFGAAKLPYDAVADFTPIAHVGDAPSIMLVPNTAPAKTVKDWLTFRNPMVR